MPPSRAILHVDLDAFFAAVEQRDRPELRGRPVIVGGPGPDRGVVATASYEARAYGIGSAMPLRTARRLCPEAVILPPDFAKYEAISRQVMSLLERFTPQVEPISLDEAFLDVTLSQPLYGPAIAIARAIKETVRREVGLPISIGIAAVKSVAKIATGLSKPDGLLEVPPGHERVFLAPLPIEHLWGVGAKTAARLRSWTITTIGQLAELPPALLEREFGVHGRRLHALARGEDPRPVLAPPAQQSLSKERTFLSDIADNASALEQLAALALEVGAALREEGRAGRVVSVKLRTHDFVTFTRQRSLPAPTNSTAVIFETARSLFLKEARPGLRWRLLGVGVSALAPLAVEQIPLPWERAARHRLLERVMDRLRARYGHHVLFPANATLPLKRGAA
jgi:DNA polymerase-4